VEEIAKAIAWVREKMTSGHTGSTPLREPFLPRLQPTSPRLAAPLRTPDWLSPSPADVETEDDGGSALGASDIGSVPTTPPAGQRTRLLSDHTAASAAPASARNVARDHAAIDGLRAQAPQHWEASPRRRRALEAAERFDERHAALSDALGRLHNKVETPSVQRQRERIIGAIQANRYTVQPLRLGAEPSPRYSALANDFAAGYALAGEVLGGPWRPLTRAAPEDRVAPAARERRAWKIEDSVWADRRRMSDSGTYWDTEESMRRALDADLRLARTGGGLERLVVRYHTLAGGRGTLAEAAGGKSGGDGKAGVGKGGKGNEPSAAMVEDLMEQVKASLWKHHELLYVTFDIYAAVGGGDFSHISINAYKQLLDDCGFIEKDGDGLNAGIWDGLFVAINSVNTVDAGDQYNHRKGLNRQEFLSFLVRAAVLRHIMHGELTDVPAAIERLVTVDVLPKIQQQHPGLAPANAFRDLACYTEQAHEIILPHTPALKAVYERYAVGRGDVGDKLRDRRLLGMDEWQEMLDDLGWMDAQVMTPFITINDLMTHDGQDGRPGDFLLVASMRLLFA